MRDMIIITYCYRQNVTFCAFHVNEDVCASANSNGGVDIRILNATYRWAVQPQLALTLGWG